MIIFITGGVRSGKSRHAQELALCQSQNPLYVATAAIWDDDFEKRVERHRADRDERWTNLEEQRTVSALPIDNQVVVIDCVTLWLTNFFVDTNNDVEASLALLKKEVDTISQKPGTFIIISNEIGMGIHPATEIGRKFADLQGWANQYIAALASEVVFMVSGIATRIKRNE